MWILDWNLRTCGLCNFLKGTWCVSMIAPNRRKVRNKTPSFFDIIIKFVVIWYESVPKVEKYMNVHKNQKKDHLQPLQTILRRKGPFVSFLAHSSARNHTRLQKLLQVWTKLLRFEHPVLRALLQDNFFPVNGRFLFYSKFYSLRASTTCKL